MSYAAIAERYARAIFDIGVETGQLAQLSEQIRKIADVYAGSEELRGVLDNPVIGEHHREGLLKDLSARLGLSDSARNAVRLLAARRRLRALPDVARYLRKMADEKEGILRATVTSAKPLSEAYYRQITGELEKATRCRIVLTKEQDPSLIAGVVTRIGDNTIDGSVRGQLRALQRQLTS
jgi:F-type H+-transporting ATPase subunit delta